MPAACTRICTSSSTGSPISISSTRNGELSSHSRAPLVFMNGTDRTRSRTPVKKVYEQRQWILLVEIRFRYGNRGFACGKSDLAKPVDGFGRLVARSAIVAAWGELTGRSWVAKHWR